MPEIEDELAPILRQAKANLLRHVPDFFAQLAKRSETIGWIKQAAR